MNSNNGTESPTAGLAAANLQLYTAEEAGALLRVDPGWLRKKATARKVPCTFVGRYLRFSTADLAEIIRAGGRSAAGEATFPAAGIRA